MPIARNLEFTPVEHPADHPMPDIKDARLAQVDEFCHSAKNASEDPEHDAACDAYADELKRQINEGGSPMLYAGWPLPSPVEQDIV